MKIRRERPEDIDAIHQLNEEAFEGAEEADIVVRDANALTLSLVAVLDETVVGHIAFSSVTIESENGSKEAIGLAPMAVLPKFQRKGIGIALVNAGLSELIMMGHCAVVVVGHPEYYPRFGFTPASSFGIRWEIEVPDEAFMLKELTEGALRGVTGIVKYRPEFNG